MIKKPLLWNLNTNFRPSTFEPCTLKPCTFEPSYLGNSIFGPSNFRPCTFGSSTFGSLTFWSSTFGSFTFGSSSLKIFKMMIHRNTWLKREKTAKYNFFTFPFVNLFYQFQRLANAYFLFMLILQCINVISSVSPVGTAVPLVLVLAVTMIKARDPRNHPFSNCPVWGKIKVDDKSSINWTLALYA